MGRWITAALLCTWLGACAARGTHAEHATAEADGPRKFPRREQTWDEYYSEIAERSRKHGVMVLWINPPSVHAAATNSDPHPITSSP